MTRPLFNKAFAVGLLVAVCGIAFLVAFTFFRKGGYSDKDTYRVHAFYEDATGLTWKSRVQIAGIQVGEIERITLEDRRARLDMRIKKEIDVRGDACVTKRFPSTLLPDALLDLAPGTEKAPSLRSLPEEQRQLTCVLEGTSVGKLLDSLSKVSADVQKMTAELTEMVSGSQGSIKGIIANLESVSQTLKTTVNADADKVSGILENTRSFTATLADVAESDQGRYRNIAKNIESASARLDQVLGSVQTLLGDDGKGDLGSSIADARQSLSRINSSMEQIEKIASNVAQGKGVAGKLLADERLGEKLSTTIESASDYYDRLFKLQVKVNLRSEWLLNQTGAKTYAGITLVPRPDKYYILEIVNDPRGVKTQSVETVTTPTGTTSLTRTLTEQKVNLSFQFAKRFGPAAFRVGLIESSGGAGADLFLLDDALKISLSVFQFARPAPEPKFPRAKLSVDYTFLRFFYATLGTDDFLNTWQSGRYPGGPKFALGNDVFFGGGLVFTDDDMKALLGAAGSAVSGVTGTK